MAPGYRKQRPFLPHRRTDRHPFARLPRNLHTSEPPIQHVTHRVADAEIDFCTDFYGLLGFAPVSPPPTLRTRAVWLQHPGSYQQIHLMRAENSQPGGGHIALVAPDFEDTVAQLQAAGHEVELRAPHWGAPRAYVRDPAGNLVELMAWPPGDAPSS